ncbi:aldo/keto reductase [Streptomyces monashensis]|uniref:aldo/keto reductase n=1 Tax=Streptomyces monashensis TaxID=1678012 RepID=UPI0026BA519C
MIRTPARVAPAWLLGRSGNVAPIVAATKTAQLADNPASAELRLDADAVRSTTSSGPAS